MQQSTLAGHPELSVGFVLLPDFTLLALSGFVEALRVAADNRDHSKQVHCGWTIMAPDLSPIRSSSGVCVLPFEKFRNPEDFDYLVIVGGLLESQKNADPRIAQYLNDATATQVSLIGLCTASFFLARCGLIKGHRCCVHQFHLSDFQKEFPSILAEANQLFIEDRRLITSPGGGSVTDLAIHLVERHCGQARVEKILCQFIIDRARPHNHPQARLALEPMFSNGDPIVRRAALLMQQHVEKPIKIKKIARVLNTNSRTLERLFQRAVHMTPTAYYHRLRLERARWLLQHSSKQIAEIAYECGFSDNPHLSRTWRSEFGSTPSNYRQQACKSANLGIRNEAPGLSPFLFPGQGEDDCWDTPEIKVLA